MLFEWHSPGSWLPHAKRLLSEEFDFEERVSDDGCDASLDESERIRFENLLLEGVSAIRMFHACRTTRVESYYENGIVAFNTDEDAFRAVKEVIEDTTIQLSDSEIRKGMKKVDPETRFEWVYANLSDLFLVDHCGGYLIFGSEYVMGVLIHARRESMFTITDPLLYRGRPTIIQLDIPLDWTSQNFRCALAGRAIDQVALALSDQDHSFEESRPNIADWFIRQQIPPEFVVGHYHPDGIRNPYHTQREPHTYYAKDWVKHQPSSSH